MMNHPTTDERLAILETKQDIAQASLEALRDDLKEGLLGIRAEFQTGLQDTLRAIQHNTEEQDQRVRALEIKQAGSTMKIKTLWAAAGSLLAIVAGFVWKVLSGS